MNKFVALCATAIVLFVGYVWLPPLQQPTVGVALPQGAALFETSLQDRISSSDTSMTLVAWAEARDTP